ncbi:ABC transporter permease [Oscillospiraceae bacterium WX1]
MHVWVFIFVAAGAALIPALSSRYVSQTRLPIGLVNEDGGSLSESLLQFLSDYNDTVTVYTYPREKALRYLAMGRLEAVFVINSDFTEKLRLGAYEGLLTQYTAPGATAAATLSETVINSVLTVWIEERAFIELDGYLSSQGIAMTAEQTAALREKFDTLLHGHNTVTVKSHIPAPPEMRSQSVVLLSSAWYAAFSSLFIIASAGWVMATRRKALGERMHTLGISPASAYTGSALAIITLSLGGWCLSGIVLALLGYGSFSVALYLLLPLALYMAGIMGLTLFLASCLSKTVQLMLIAPVFTITQGVLCGMLFTLPPWAGTLLILSNALPGRSFMLAADALFGGGSVMNFLFLALCSAAWLVLGGLAVTVSTRQKALKGA